VKQLYKRFPSCQCKHVRVENLRILRPTLLSPHFLVFLSEKKEKKRKEKKRPNHFLSFSVFGHKYIKYIARY
jgi:hypothetical protein